MRGPGGEVACSRGGPGPPGTDAAPGAEGHEHAPGTPVTSGGVTDQGPPLPPSGAHRGV